MKNIIPFISKVLAENEGKSLILREIIRRFYTETGYDESVKITNLNEKASQMTCFIAKLINNGHCDNLSIHKDSTSKIAPWLVTLKSTK